MNNSNVSNKILWIKASWNSLLVLIIAFVFYMLPGLIVGFKMGFELGPKMKDAPELSAQISETISEMYRENIWLAIGYIIVTGLLILWRSRIVSKGTGGKKYINGLIVSFLPAFVGLLFIFTRGFNLLSIAEIIIFLGLGLLGSILQEKSI